MKKSLLWAVVGLVLMVASLVFFVVMANTRAGVRDVNPDYINVLRIMGADERTILRKVILPSAAGWIYASLQIALPWALIGAVIAEFFLSIGGLGYYILYNSRSYKHAEAFVGVLLLAAFGVCFELLVFWATKRFMPWYRRER